MVQIGATPQERWYSKLMSTAPEFLLLRQIGYTGSLADMRNAYYNDLINGKYSPFGSDSPPNVGEIVPDVEALTTNGGNVQPTSGQLRLSHFTAKRTETITGVTVYTGTAGAAATPTLCRMGIYSIDNAVEDMTLIASTPNDTALFAAATTAYQKNFSVPWNKVAGRRYAFGILTVSGVATANFMGSFVVISAAAWTGLVPRRMSYVGGQSDLPASISAGSLAGSHMRIGAYLA